MRQQQAPWATTRLRGVFLLLTLFVVLFVLRLVQVQIVEAAGTNAISFDKRSVETVVPAIRGDIYDADGNVLAHTVYSYDVNVDPSLVANFTRTNDGQEQTVTVEQAAQELASLLNQKVATLSKNLIGAGRYANLAKGVTAETYRKIRALNIPWVYTDPQPTRVYPNGAVAGNILGFVSKDGRPLAGLEMGMNACLTGTDGLETYEKGVDGIKIPQSTQVTKVATDGNHLVLTINRDLQYYSQQVMTKYVKKYRADWGTAVVIEVETGKILAAAEAPTVDPNVYWKSDAEDRGARIFSTPVEPGSTMKTVTTASLIDAGKATPLSQVRAPYSLKVFNRTISDSHSHPTESLTLTGVMAESSNTGIVKLGRTLSEEKRYKYYQKFGLGQVTGVNFTGESTGILHDVNDPNTDEVTKIVEMFGQGMSVTPIQAAMMYQAIANGGVRLSPQLIEGCQDENGKITAPPIPEPVRVISESAARDTIDILENVVTKGPIGQTAKIPGYRVGGKTGTAQISAGKEYGSSHAISFIGMVPAENPKYVLAVTIYKPRTVTNSLGATPPWKEIMEQVLHAYRVPPSRSSSPNIDTTW